MIPARPVTRDGYDYGLYRNSDNAKRRGKSAPSAPVFLSPDGRPFTATELEQEAIAFKRQGDLGQVVRALEAALVSHSRVHGAGSDTALECGRQVADVCNMLGMQLLQRDEFESCQSMLKRAYVRGVHDPAMHAITLNNLACYNRRRGHLKVALAHLSKAADIEAQIIGAQKPADTHLNLCAVHSELKQHPEAMHHAKVALFLLHDELEIPLPPNLTARLSPHDRLGSARGSARRVAAGLLTGGGPLGVLATPSASSATPSAPYGGGDADEADADGGEGGGDLGVGGMVAGEAPRARSKERMAVLAIAYHNLAVEQEALRLPEEAAVSFAEAAGIASRELGSEHPVARSLYSTHRAYVVQREKAQTARMKAMQASHRHTSAEEKVAAERRKQESVQKHIQLARGKLRP